MSARGCFRGYCTITYDTSYTCIYNSHWLLVCNCVYRSVIQVVENDDADHRAELSGQNTTCLTRYQLRQHDRGHSQFSVRIVIIHPSFIIPQHKSKLLLMACSFRYNTDDRRCCERSQSTNPRIATDIKNT